MIALFEPCCTARNCMCCSILHCFLGLLRFVVITCCSISIILFAYHSVFVQFGHAWVYVCLEQPKYYFLAMSVCRYIILTYSFSISIAF